MPSPDVRHLRRRSQAAHVFIRFRLGRAFSKDVRFIDAVYTIRDKQNELFRHANYNPTEYFALRSKTYPQPKAGLTYEPMSLTYQPMTLKEKGLNDLGDIKIQD